MDPQSGAETEDWTTLKGTLKKRFEEKITADITYNTSQALTKMKEDESFETFADRITIAIRLLDKDLSDALRNSDEYEAIFVRETINVFLCGIPDIKTFILDHHPKEDLFEMAKAAQNHVNHMKAKKLGQIVQGLQVNDISHQMTDEYRDLYVAEVVNQMETWRASNPSKPFQFQPPSSQSSTRGRGNGGHGRGSRRGNSAS